MPDVLPSLVGSRPIALSRGTQPVRARGRISGGCRQPGSPSRTTAARSRGGLRPPPALCRGSRRHAYLTSASPLRAGFLAAAGAALTTLGVADPERHAPALVALTDGLLFDRVAGAGVDPAARPDAYATIDAVLRGLPRS